MPKPKKHKRKKAKSQRAGCLMCKPHKANGCEHEKHSERIRIAKAEDTRE